MPKKVLTESSKPAYQPWNHEEFLADRWVKRMSCLERKTYATLLHEAFFCSTRPYLPSDEEELEVLADCESIEEWLSIRDNVLKMFEKIEINGNMVLCSKRVEGDWERLLESRNIRSTRAKNAAQAKHKQAQADYKDAHACQVRERVIEEKEISEREETEDGQDNMKIKNELQTVCAGFGVKAGGFKSTWDEISNLAKGNSVGAVVTDFTAWMEDMQGDDFPNGAVSAYLYVASDRLSADSAPAQQVLKDPEVVSLARELTSLSGGSVAFMDKQKTRLGEVLKEFTAEEITAAFKTWLDNQDLNDPKNVLFLPGKFVQLADGLAYNLRHSRIQKSKSEAERAAVVQKLQEQAEAERLEREKKKLEEENLFDPLA